MAASSQNVVRVRLHFDYPPPAVSTCRMCWLLIDLNRCRVVADLVSVIREKFDYSRKTCLDLFIEDCYLPPSECIYVVRDNDSIRVKAESLSQQNETELETSKSSKVKKRRRETEEQEVQGEQSNISALKKRKSTEEGQAVHLGVTENVKKKKKSKKRKRKEELASERQTETANKTPAASGTKPLSEKSSKRLQHSTSSFNGKPVARKPQETSSDSSDSSDEELSKRSTQHPKPQRKVSSSAGAVSKLGSAAKHKGNSSSSSSESDTVQPPAKKPTPAKSLPAKPKPSPANAAVNTKPKQPPSKKQAQSSSSDSDSDSSSSAERPPPKRTPVRIPPPVPTSNTKATATASASVSKKPAAKTAETSSDSDSSSSLERPIKKPSAPSTPKDPSSAPSSAHSRTPAAKLAVEPSAKPASTASESDSSEEIKLVIRKPVLNGLGLSVAEVVSSSPIVGAGRGRGDGRSPGRGMGRGEGRFARRGSGSRDRGRGNGRGNGTPWNKGFRYEYSDEEQKRSRRFNDSLTNTSLILQNPPEPAPKRDYGVFPLLAAPPAVGQKIAFKLLELTENYSPEVSDYKEGKITGFNVTTNMVELQLLSRPKVPVEPGKFDLVYENPDGSEVVEYAVTQGSQLTERWDSLLEPRLIVENVG